MDNVRLSVSGVLYAGENLTNYISADGLIRAPNTKYFLRLVGTDSESYIEALPKIITVGKYGQVTNAYMIPGSLIVTPGKLQAQLMSKAGDNPYIALTSIYTFNVLRSIEFSEETPPPLEASQTLAERAIEAADRADESADRAQEILDQILEGGASGGGSNRTYTTTDTLPTAIGTIGSLDLSTLTPQDQAPQNGDRIIDGDGTQADVLSVDDQTVNFVVVPAGGSAGSTAQLPLDDPSAESISGHASNQAEVNQGLVYSANTQQNKLADHEGRIEELEGSPPGYILPAATDEIRGGIRVGTNLLIDGDVLSVDTANDLEGDNTRPVTAAFVDLQLGNIEAWLETI